MSCFKKKTLLNDFKAIKFGILGCFVLFGTFFITERVLASTFFDDSFETYSVGILGGQGYWKSRSGSYDFQVSTTTAQSGTKSITPYSLGHAGYSHSNSKDGTGIATTNQGIISFWFYTENYNIGGIFFGLKKGYQYYGYDNYQPVIFSQSTPDIYIRGGSTSTEKIASSYPLETWNKITIEYDYILHKARAKFNTGVWSNWVILSDTMDYADNILPEIAGMEHFYLDSIRAEALYLPVCGYDENCDYCYSSSTCEYHNCFWNEEQNFCYSTPAPVLPPLEDCSGYGLTDRLICEIKNFFSRLFSPTPEKITELKNTINLVKDKFPYNYILATKDFFVDLKDNIQEQPITFKILGKAGVVNFNFWNSTTTLAGITQNFTDIFKKVWIFIILFIFVFWCISFIKRIFK